MHEPSDYHPGERDGSHYDGMDSPGRELLRASLELHLLHIRLAIRKFCRRLHVLHNRAGTTSRVASHGQNLPALLIDWSVAEFCHAGVSSSTYRLGVPFPLSP